MLNIPIVVLSTLTISNALKKLKRNSVLGTKYLFSLIKCGGNTFLGE